MCRYLPRAGSDPVREETIRPFDRPSAHGMTHRGGYSLRNRLEAWTAKRHDDSLSRIVKRFVKEFRLHSSPFRYGPQRTDAHVQTNSGQIKGWTSRSHKKRTRPPMHWRAGLRAAIPQAALRCQQDRRGATSKYSFQAALRFLPSIASSAPLTFS